MNDVKKVLSGYYWANIEVKRMQKRRDRLQRKATLLAGDTVRGSMPEPPYIERVVRIEGSQIAALQELEYEIDNAIEEGLKRLAEAERIIRLSDDPKEREILRSRFVDCMSWEQVGKVNHVAPDYARRVVRQFIQKVS